MLQGTVLPRLIGHQHGFAVAQAVERLHVQCNGVRGLVARGGYMGLHSSVCMGGGSHDGLRECGLLKPPHPTPIGGGDSGRLAYRTLPEGTGEPFGSPPEPPEKGTNDKAADSAKETTAFVVGV